MATAASMEDSKIPTTASAEDMSISQIDEAHVPLKMRVKYGLERTKRTLTTKEGWIGEYNYGYLFTPDISLFNKKYVAQGFTQPFYGLDDELPILLTLLLGLQHALTLVVSIVAPPLLVAQFALNFNSADTQYLISAVLICTGLVTAVQITRFHIFGTPYYVGTGLLSVVGPTFDVFGLVLAYANNRYASGTCPSDAAGNPLPCPDAWGAVIGTIMVTVWIQVLMALVPPKLLKRVFPTLVTGTLLVILAAYLTGSGMKNWGGGSGCYHADYPCSGGVQLMWGHARYIGLGFSVIASIVMIELFGSPFMKSSAIILGLAVGCVISAATGFWEISAIKEAPVATFLWTTTFKIRVDGALVLPLMIMFLVQGVSCIPDILATSEASRLPITTEKYNSRVQGGIMCDGLGSLLSAFAGSLPMVSQAANNGVILLTNCAARRAGYVAAVILFLMGIFGKVGAVFVAMPKPVLGGMQVFLFGTIAVAGFKILAGIDWSRRNRFILTCAMGVGFAGCIIPDWFSNVITYVGPNQSLEGFIEGVELVVETPFIFAAVIAVILNAAIPMDTKSAAVKDVPGESDIPL